MFISSHTWAWLTHLSVTHTLECDTHTHAHPQQESDWMVDLQLRDIQGPFNQVALWLPCLNNIRFLVLNLPLCIFVHVLVCNVVLWSLFNSLSNMDCLTCSRVNSCLLREAFHPHTNIAFVSAFQNKPFEHFKQTEQNKQLHIWVFCNHPPLWLRYG